MLLKIDLRLKQLFDKSLPFGGKSMIFFGDFAQLRPVGDLPITEIPENALERITGVTLFDLFTSFQLTEIMRQREDALFANALTRLAAGEITEVDIELFKSRETPYNDVPNGILHLFQTNQDAMSHNDALIGQGNDVTTATAIDKALADGVAEAKKQQQLEAAKVQKLNMTYGLCYNLRLRVGIHYMITVNCDVQDGLVNGAVGILRAIEEKNSIPIRLWIEFTEEETGSQRRKTCSHPNEPTWTPIERIKRDFYLTKSKTIGIHRVQFPVIPAEGMLHNR